jgi:hypothetical protein
MPLHNTYFLVSTCAHFLGALGVLSEAGGYKIFNRQDAKIAKKNRADARLKRLVSKCGIK